MSIEQAWADYQTAYAAHVVNKAALVTTNNDYLVADAALVTAQTNHHTAGTARDVAKANRDISGSALDSAGLVLFAALGNWSLFSSAAPFMNAVPSTPPPTPSIDDRMDRVLLLLEQMAPALAQMAPVLAQIASHGKKGR